MKIIFDNRNQNPNVDRITTSKSEPSFYKLDRTGGIALDISGIVMDNTAYGDHGRTTEDVMQEADSKFDIGLQRDYMTVMSNSMSAGDFNRMMEHGFDPSQMDTEEVVTIIDHIKAEMMKSGTVIAGYNDSLSTEKLTQITGDPSYARKLEEMMKKSDIPGTMHNVKSIQNAVNEMETITDFSDGSMKYMVENDLEPTIENIYLASYSAAGDGNKQPKGYYAQEMQGYYAKKADELNWEQLSPQIEKTVAQMDINGISQDAKTENAKWLIEKGIPVTQKAMERLYQIQSISFPISKEDTAKAAVIAISEGKEAVNGNLLSDYQSIYEQAVELKDKTERIDEKAVWKTVTEEKEWNLKNLFAVSDNTEEIRIDVTNPSFIEAKRVLEEVRLQMTIDANIRLLKNGVSIDTTELSQLVDQLKQQESEIKSKFFDETDTAAVEQKATLYQNTTAVLKEIPYLPSAVLGRMTATQDKVSLSYVYENGLQIQNKLEAAGEAYETLMTAPRKDMGDSIQKAFQNVDDILADLELEPSYENQKAVRSLAYNGQIITKESINKVKLANNEVENIVKSMSPGKTLQLIREGKNPLTMSLTELDRELRNIELQPVEETEKFSKYLYQMEQKKEITEAEREAYIGVYRLFHQIEKSDGAAVESLISQGAELTLGNLLSAVRSKKANIDVTINDDFGLLSETINKGTSISAQIEDGILEARLSQSIAHNVYRDMNIEALQSIDITDDTTLQEIAQAVSQTEDGKISAYEQSIMQDIRTARNVDDVILQTLKTYEQPSGINQILAADQMIHNSSDLYQTSRKYAAKMEDSNTTQEESTINRLSEAAEQITENFNSKEEAQTSYLKYTDTMSGIFRQAADSVVDNTIDIKAISLCHKQLSLLNSLAGQERYEIPVVIGEGVTSIHLSIQKGTQQKGMVKAFFETPQYGNVSATFTQSEQQIQSFFTSDNKEGLEKLKQVSSIMEQNMRAQGKEMKDTHFILGNPPQRLTDFESNADNNIEAVSNRDLYRLAKSFLTAFHSV